MSYLKNGSEQMVNPGQQLRTKRNVERLFTSTCKTPVSKLERELFNLGFIETGADPVAIAMENRTMELYLEIELDDLQCIHGYQVLSFVEKAKKQRKFRW
jgi:hypothetical protein